MKHIHSPMLDREMKKGRAESLIPSLVEPLARHGYEISKFIEARSKGALKFKVGSLYSLLYRLEKRGWIAGHRVEKPGEKRRRCYKLTKEGKQALKAQRSLWQSFVAAINQITGLENA